MTAASVAMNLDHRRNGVIALPGIGEKMVTKGQSKLSEDGIKQRIKEMTKQDQATGRNSHSSAEWHQLLNDYVSFASPDRTGIIKSTLSGLMRRLGMLFKPHMNLLEMIMRNYGIFRTKDIGDNFINVRDGSGQVIATYNKGTGWSNVFTPEENARHKEFIMMWNDEKKKACQVANETITVIRCTLSGFPVDLSRGAYDMEKLADYGITFDAETGQTNVDKEKLHQATGHQAAETPTIGYSSVWYC